MRGSLGARLVLIGALVMMLLMPADARPDRPPAADADGSAWIHQDIAQLSQSRIALDENEQLHFLGSDIHGRLGYARPNFVSDPVLMEIHPAATIKDLVIRGSQGHALGRSPDRVIYLHAADMGQSVPAWSSTVVLTDDGFHQSMTVDEDGRPWIFVTRGRSIEAWTPSNGTWRPEIASPYGPHRNFEVAAATHEGIVHVAYSRTEPPNPGLFIEVASRATNGTWTVEKIDPGSYVQPEFVVDDKGTLWLFYLARNAGQWELRVAKKTDDGWSIETVHANSYGPKLGNALAADARKGRMVVAHANETELFVFDRTPTGWVQHSVDTDSPIRPQDIEILDDGRVMVVYRTSGEAPLPAFPSRDETAVLAMGTLTALDPWRQAPISQPALDAP